MHLTLLGIIAGSTICSIAVDCKAAESNPLAPSEAGKILCVEPDFAFKNCLGISRFTKQMDGTYIRNSEEALPSPFNLQIKGPSNEYFKGDQLCYRFNGKDLDGFTFKQNGRTITGKERQLLIDSLNLLVNSIGITEACEKQEAINVCGRNVVRIVTNFNGEMFADMPEDPKYAVWVDENEGFTLREDGSDGPSPFNACQS
jgi:hypothetical protein